MSSKSSAAGTTAPAAPLRKPAGVPLRVVRPERDPGCAFFTPVCRHRDGRVESDEEWSAARNDWGCRSNMPPICLQAGVRQDFERNSPKSCEADLLWLLLHVLLQNACRSRGTGTVPPSFGAVFVSCGSIICSWGHVEASCNRLMVNCRSIRRNAPHGALMSLI